MNIILNNNPEYFETESMTVAELIQYKNFTFRMLVTKINGQLVKTVEREKAIISDGDKVEVLHLISGG